MKLKSLIQNGQQLEVAEVEIEFIPGIPQIHFLGLPDRIIKESFYRIKSALKSSGYKFPLTQQMIVNIKPHHLRKSSRGVELAVALGILLKSKQISEDLLHPNWVLYGELGLDGSVYEPSDLRTCFTNLEKHEVLTGWAKDAVGFYHRLPELKTFEITRAEESQAVCFERPSEGLKRFYSESEAEFLFLSATSGFHGLLAGDAGAGKSTLAKALLSFLPEPSSEEIGRWKKNWRPIVAPHHTITAAAFLGGGAQLYVGEVERAHNGVLLLDELLQFEPEIVETLRGPMVGEVLRLVRGALDREIHCQFQVIATTNLCPCGKWTPLKEDLSCRFSRIRCMKYLERLSGPLVDRFGIMFFTSLKTERTVSGFQILKKIEKVHALMATRDESFAQNEEVLKTFYSDCSLRRKNYLTKLAWIIFLDRGGASEELRPSLPDFKKAEEWALTPFLQLEKGMS